MKIRGNLIIDIETDVSDNESDSKTLKFLVDEDLKDLGYNVHSLQVQPAKRHPDPNGDLPLTPEELREYKEKFMTPIFQTDFIGVRMDDVGDACVIFKHQYTRDEMGYKIANTKEFLWLAERFELEVTE